MGGERGLTLAGCRARQASPREVQSKPSQERCPAPEPQYKSKSLCPRYIAVREGYQKLVVKWQTCWDANERRVEREQSCVKVLGNEKSTAAVELLGRILGGGGQERSF